MSHKNRLDHCLNCSNALQEKDNYCPICGQENHTLELPLKHIVHEVFESTIHFDAKIFQTFYLLLFKPGFLTKEFNEGKRVKYVPPVRTYIFVSFLFFLVIGFTSAGNVTTKKGDQASIIMNDSTNGTLPIYKTDNDDSVSVAAITLDDSSEVGKMMSKKIIKLDKEGYKDFQHAIFKNASYGMFLFMPFFGLFVYLFNRSQKKYYLGSLIYSIHLHSFLFIWILIYIGLSYIISNTFIDVFFLLLPLAYMYYSLKTAYPQSRKKALLKTFLISFCYAVSFIIFLIFIVIVSIIIF